jgi:hypothetical protein
MNGYVCFYNRKRIEIYAESLYAAKLDAVKQFKPRKSQEHMVSVVLAEVAGKPVVHHADF